MVQQSHNAWQSNSAETAASPSTGQQGGPTVATWMQDVLGDSRPTSGGPINTQSSPSNAHAAPSPDLQSRLAAIARNIEALETKVTGDPRQVPQAGQTAGPSVQSQSMVPPHATPAPSGSGHTVPVAASQPMDPLEALRRRKMELEGHPASLDQEAPSTVHEQVVASPHSTPQHVQNPLTSSQAAEPVTPTSGGSSVASSPGMMGGNTTVDGLSARMDEQFSRLSQAIDSIRQIADASVHDKARLDALESYVSGNAADKDAQGAALADLSEQVRAVRDAITAMPAPDAIKSLEEGYSHVLTRLDTLKSDGAADQKIDALYEEVTGLRELLDQLREGGTSTVVEEMRGMLQRLEQDPGADSARLAQALEAATKMAEGQSAEGLNDAIGAIVERLVALEARIEALAAGHDDSPIASRLDAIQNEMSRLATFQDEAKGLSQALDAVRDEVRSSNAGVDWTTFEQRFGALDRIEQVTGGYADQIASLSDRLNALDGTIANQADMARQVSALSRQMETFTNAMPVREIEQAVLELTGRVTALQEDTGTERLAIAVRELGERVESCIRSIPKTETIIEAVEAKIGEQLEDQLDARLSHAMEPVVTRLDTLHATITEADGPLIEHMAGRLEALISAMPTPRAEDALNALEQQLGEINQRQADAGVISRDDVTRLHNELTRARASVELGSNRDLQRSIVDQVRHLADRFDNARIAGDASALPEVEAQIEALVGRVQSLGLFDNQNEQPAFAEDLIQHIDQRFNDLSEAQTPSVPGVDQLYDELAALRRNAGDQDLRMQETLENVQQALETVSDRISALESDDEAALNLAETSAGMTTANKATEDVRSTSPMPDLPEEKSAKPVVSIDLPDLPKSDHSEEIASSEPEETPAPGDAQDLLRQLTGAMNVDGVGAVRPRTSRPSRQPNNPARTEAVAASGLPDAASQRASFIAAARRAAQSAALQAASGKSPSSSSALSPQAPVDPSLDPFAPRPTLAGDEHPESERKEPHVDNPDASADDTPRVDEALAKTPLQELGGAAKTSRIEQKKKKQQEAQRQKTMSRAMIVALILFTLGLGLFVVSLILPSERDVAVAPLPANETVLEADARSAADAVDTVEAASNDPRILPTEDVSVRTVGEDAEAVETPSATVTSLSDENATAAESAEELSSAQPSDRDDALGSGFERDRGPVMSETPSLDAAVAPLGEASPDEAQSAPGLQQADLSASQALGPMSGLVVPSLPPATTNALPEAIGSPRLRVAASGGDSSAQFEIATRYMEGRFVPQDFSAAAHWYGLAADQGSIPAAYRLGSFYEQGRGVDRDTDSAIAWYEQAARGGNPRAMHNLAVMAAEGRGPDGATTPDFERASGWFRAAANRGLSDSQFNLAVLFARGMGVERDLLESYKWFALAANAGDSEAVGRRDEVAGVLGEEALALARARVDNWQAIPIDRFAVEVAQPEGGWDDNPVRASGSGEVSTAQAMIAEAQTLLARRGYEPGPADGLIGPRTTDAVRAFRQSVGLGDSDVIDAALLNALRGGGNL